MLTEQELRGLEARRRWVIMPAISGATGAVFLYLVVMGHFRQPLTSLVKARFGVTVGDITEVALILPAFVIFLLPSCLATHYAQRFRSLCPSCNKDISPDTERVLSTRRCPACGERILDGGRTHSAAVYKRYQLFRSRHFLKHWFWAWPALGGSIITWELLDRSAFQRCPQCVWTAPLIGTATAGWAWLRTSDRRYVPQLLASVVLLGLGVVLFWQAL
jgi:predicted RNA-binding Zn-ribbon protein involved in translation (DUF1610 family)